MQDLQTGKGSLTRLLPVAQSQVAQSEKAQLQAWCFGLCRWTHQLAGIADQLLDKPLKAKDLDVYLLVQLGIFQLMHTPIASHAAVDETVKVTRKLKKPWARAVVNALLRNFIRRRTELESGLSEAAEFSHPPWLLKQIKADWPQQWQSVCRSNNLQGPMTLRVNHALTNLREYAEKLSSLDMSFHTVSDAPHALILENAVNVFDLPGFDGGEVSVQDAAAQLASHQLTAYVAQGGRLVDACAAPGGKTAHVLEMGHFSSVLALDKDSERLARVRENITRLKLSQAVELICCDARELGGWWDGIQNDAVLLDAPCSGTGVIRRHPDIKLLRRPSDIKNLVKLQADLMDSLWQTLRPGGVMLYATCSVLKAENQEQVQAFLQRTEDAELINPVLQILPGENQMDGFFYAPLRKTSQ
jgi:16S rRNA (cytosine967-C5)-methyltransferase